MPLFKVKVKWGKENYPDVEVNTEEDPLVFKAQLFALTGVHPERQKIVVKGVTLKDWSNVSLRNGCPVLLMGTKEEDTLVEPEDKPVFMEDMNENELATALDLPAGLTNLGNTCYMNATVQCLKTVPELRDSLKSFRGAISLGEREQFASAESITAALRDVYEYMDKGGTFPPFILVRVLHLAFPRFAQKSEHGGFQQQDANECWTELIRMLQQKLPPSNTAQTSFKSLVEQYFGGTFDFEMKCTESDDELATGGKENFLQLSCFITPEVKYMLSGLKNKLQEQITKHSPTLDRDAIYLKTSKISRLPAYLTVQFVRFFYKEKGSINAKILKDIKFPLEFDAFELCSSELQAKLTPMRSRFKEVEDAQLEQDLKNKKDLEVKKPDGESKIKTKTEPYWFEDDVGSNNSGYYTLQAVLTHKGRSSSSGHYVAWVKQHNSNNWVKCDDEIVTPVTEEEVLKLSGGGDWHCAYVLLYGSKVLQVPLTTEQSESTTQST